MDDREAEYSVQPLVEAEYRVMAMVTNELVCIKSFLASLRFFRKDSPEVILSQLGSFTYSQEPGLP